MGTVERGKIALVASPVPIGQRLSNALLQASLWSLYLQGQVEEGVGASKRELDCSQQEHGGPRGPAELCLGILMPIQEI